MRPTVYTDAMSDVDDDPGGAGSDDRASSGGPPHWPRTLRSFPLSFRNRAGEEETFDPDKDALGCWYALDDDEVLWKITPGRYVWFRVEYSEPEDARGLPVLEPLLGRELPRGGTKAWGADHRGRVHPGDLTPDDDEPAPLDPAGPAPPSRQDQQPPPLPAAPKRKRTRKPRPWRPTTLKGLAAAIRAESRDRNVPKFLELADRKIREEGSPAVIPLAIIKKACHGDERVDDDTARKTVKSARRKIVSAKLPYTLRQSGSDVVIQEDPPRNIP
jgi:hypothetical protein